MQSIFQAITFFKSEEIVWPPYQVTDLDPCQPWSFRLRAPPSIVDGIIQLGSVLWTFEANTAPIPHIQAIAGTIKKFAR